MRRRACFWLLWLCRLNSGTTCQRYRRKPQNNVNQRLSACPSLVHLGFFVFIFPVVRQKLLPARALRVQEDAGETGPAHNKGGVAKTAFKSRTDASRGGRNRVPQGVHTSLALRNTSASATPFVLCLTFRNSKG